MLNVSVLFSWLLIGALGVAAFVLALDFRVGSLANIGAAIYPLGLSAVIVLVSALRLFCDRDDMTSRPELRPLLAIVASVLLFVASVDHLGLVPAAILSTFAAYLGQPVRGYGVVLLYALLLGTGAWLIFSYGLGVPLSPVRGL